MSLRLEIPGEEKVYDDAEDFFSPGEEVTLYCEVKKCDVKAYIALAEWDLGDVGQNHDGTAKFYIRTVSKFLHTDLYWDTTGSVCSADY